MGLRSTIGPQALEKALQEMVPGDFRRIDVEHEVVQALLVNEAHFRRIPEAKIVELILRHTEGMMDATESLHIDMDVAIESQEEFEL